MRVTVALNSNDTAENAMTNIDDNWQMQAIDRIDGAECQIDVRSIVHQNGRRIVTARVTGKLGMHDLVAFLTLLSNNDLVSMEDPTLWDFRDYDFENNDMPSFRGLAFVWQKFPDRGQIKKAYLVADDSGYGTMRMLENSAVGFGLSEDGLLRVGFDPSELIDWLARDA